MQASASGAPRYAGVADAMVKIARQEGVTSLQKGLVPGMIYQVFMNGTRLGCYPTAKRLLQDDGSESLANVARGVCAGAATGGMGAVVGSPFFMVKCRLQAQSTASGIEGFQHHYKGMIDGLIQARQPICGPRALSAFCIPPLIWRRCARTGIQSGGGCGPVSRCRRRRTTCNGRLGVTTGDLRRVEKAIACYRHSSGWRLVSFRFVHGFWIGGHNGAEPI